MSENAMTIREKEVEQLNLIHEVFASCSNDSFTAYWKAIKKLAKLREEDPYKVAFTIVKHLNDENMKLIKAKGDVNVESN